jgi:hypothetical protein
VANVGGAAASGSRAVVWRAVRSAGGPVWFRAKPVMVMALARRLPWVRKRSGIGAAGCQSVMRGGGMA